MTQTQKVSSSTLTSWPCYEKSIHHWVLENFAPTEWHARSGWCYFSWCLFWLFQNSINLDSNESFKSWSFQIHLVGTGSANVRLYPLVSNLDFHIQVSPFSFVDAMSIEFTTFCFVINCCSAELAKSIGIGDWYWYWYWWYWFLSCIGIGIVKTIFEVLVLVLVLLREFPKYWYWYC